MANPWKHKRGPGKTVVVTNGGVAVSKGDPLKFSSNTAIAATDGSTVDLVAAEDAAASAQLTAIIPDGDVFEVVTGADLNQYDRAYMASTNKIDAGSSGNISNMFVVDYNPTSGGLALVMVKSNLMTSVTHS